jgi:hypothetical protein
MCPQPTPGNLIPNPGFDTGLSGWTVSPGTGSVFWDQTDSLGCPFSGRARLSWPDDGSGDLTSPPTISTCVPVRDGLYNAGIRTYRAAFCDAYAYASEDCTGVGTFLVPFEALANWTAFQREIQTPAGARSAAMICYPYDRGTWEFSIDMAFFSPAPGLY